MSRFRVRRPGAYTDADVEAVRKQVAREGWSRIVGVRAKGELAEIYLWKEGGTNGGLVVIAAEANELTVVNIVGNVDLASLAALGPMIPKFGKGNRSGYSRLYSLDSVISNTRGHNFPVTKIRFFCASYAMPLSTASDGIFALGAPSNPLRLIQPSTRPSLGEILAM